MGINSKTSSPYHVYAIYLFSMNSKSRKCFHQSHWKEGEEKNNTSVYRIDGAISNLDISINLRTTV